MKTEKLLYEHYSRMIKEVETPEVPSVLDGVTSGRKNHRLPSLIAAALIALSFIPLITSVNSRPLLAVKSADFSRKTELGIKITEQLSTLHKISENSFNTGGKK